MSKPRCKRCGKPLTDPVSIAAGLGPQCRGAAQKSRSRRVRQTERHGRGGGSAINSGNNGLSVGMITPIWRVYDIPDGNIEAVLVMHRERYGKPQMVLLAQDVSKEIYTRAKQLAVIVIKNRKVLPGQVWVV
ncbi:hypothetical protein BECAL_02965 [Bellilinea caldifistulae]|uniref:Uncharacterized protein n=1 Tax=Bellilinea caldifistulae TaxID=360411 RepID=A0A0P6XI00_9CHLR|nr:DUF6011 domain-containing protein [Bellilinea caldifistulae]KPL74560.1 hypothetical protein AC812_12250 [Bellilinea caldifistulae]GAP11772.1 hypothetical protein BECAL_02965 [Bellilinea caldifistulae]